MMRNKRKGEKKQKNNAVYHAQLATTGAVGRSAINERRQGEGRRWMQRRDREKGRKADRLGSPPPLRNQGGEDTEGRRKRRRERGAYAWSSAVRQPQSLHRTGVSIDSDVCLAYSSRSSHAVQLIQF